MLGGVGGIDRQAEVDRGWAVGILHQRQDNPRIEQSRFDAFHGGFIANGEGEDRGEQVMGGEIERTQDLTDMVDVGAEGRVEIVIGLEQSQRFDPGRDEWRGCGGGASVGDGVIAGRLDGSRCAHDDSAGAPESLGQRGRHDELIGAQVEFVGGAFAVIAQDGESVAVVEDEPVVLAECRVERVGWGEIAIGGEDGIGEDGSGGGQGMKDGSGMLGVEVVVEVDIHPGECRSILEAGMGAGVDQGVGDAHRFEPLHGGEVGGIPVGDQEPGLVGAECGELGFELGMGAGVAGGFSGGGAR